ncbi:DUF5134 domain-containing protein [Streptomyces sp. NBC_00887]|uniref:DUF5134 domain-containing protein n=1 Tax=Streptomyces sp. NBC_00887 TaxID=2975859 RepID=UPI00386F4A23|nr:DUF5134 domain-containing protein [Streptomyces sp. NBC_00887]WSY35699.1 DUF5134 domain-containing protein [Streptomyces sp. NBC_00887]
MHGPAPAGWLLMVLCGATGAYSLVRTRSGTEEERRTARAEGLMGFGMAAMAVPAAVFTLPGWTWAVYAVLFGGAALRVLVAARYRAHHLHHLVGSLAMVYMAVAMARNAGRGVSGGHMDHGAAGSAASAGGIPLLTGALLAYYALYVLRSAGRLIPVTAAAGPGSPGRAAGPGRGSRPELALACRLTLGIGMLAMLLTL